MKKLLLALLLSTHSFSIFSAEKNWVIDSDKIAEAYSKDMGKIYPESASSIGYAEFDDQILHLSGNTIKDEKKLNQKWIKLLDQKIKSEKNHNVLIDLKILKQKIQQNIDGIVINEKIGDIPFYPGSKWIYNQLQILINPQSSIERKKSAVDKFKKYVNGDGGEPILNSFASYIKLKEKNNKSKKFYSIKNEMELYLSESSDYLKGINELLNQSGREDWYEDFVKFENQVKVFDDFIKTNQLTKARTDYRLPKDIYKFILKIRGMDNSPENMIKIGRSDYKELYKVYIKIANEIAVKNSLKFNDPVSVIKFLKSKQITTASEAEKVYREIDVLLTKIINENNIITLPKTPLVMRVAGDAESKASPVPHLLPPPLINNKGERPEFIIPSSSTGSLPFDDFSYKEAAYILVAHEGRPGHDLQFSSMLDNGVSIIRSRYAFNNVNIEGWALYAEDLIYPHLPLEAKLSAIQMRLWRMARMYLDPEVQLGISNSKDVDKVFIDELGVSPVMSGLEYRRYTFEDPGQAPAYYYGFLKIKEIYADVKKAHSVSFNDKCFNDSLISLGLLPMNIIKEELINNLKCN